MKVLTLRTVAVLALTTITVWIGRRRTRWSREMKAFESSLLQEQQRELAAPQQSWDDLPVSVQKYFRRVFSKQLNNNNKQQDDSSTAATSPFRQPNTVPYIQSLRFEQKGIFLLNQNWLPFTARQVTAAHPSNLGFLWEATMETAPAGTTGWWKRWMPHINVCDVWLQGQGYLRARILGAALPIISDATFKDQQDELARGEMTRWLPEAFLVPTALLPDAGVVTWDDVVEPRDEGEGEEENQKPQNSKQARLSMVDPHSGRSASMTVTFDKDEIEVRGMRPAAGDGGTFVDKPWIGWMSEFRLIHDMWIPTHMEGGWIDEESGAVELYFNADLMNFHFEFVKDADTVDVRKSATSEG